MTEVLENHQYHVKVNGSNRITLRNRRYLRKIEAVVDSQQHGNLLQSALSPSNTQLADITTPTTATHQPLPPVLATPSPRVPRTIPVTPTTPVQSPEFGQSTPAQPQ